MYMLPRGGQHTIVGLHDAHARVQVFVKQIRFAMKRFIRHSYGKRHECPATCGMPGGQCERHVINQL